MGEFKKFQHDIDSGRYQGGRARRDEKFIADYVYQTMSGENYLRVSKTEDKRFLQQHWDGKYWQDGKPKGPKLPYNLPELLKLPLATTVFLTEGEKDADSVSGLQLPSTCCSEGAGKWKPELNNWFAGRKEVIVLQDNDEAGRRHADQVASNLSGYVEIVKVVLLPGLGEKEDVTDWINAGHSKEELLEICARAPIFHRQFIDAVPFSLVDPSSLKPRNWLYGMDYIASYVSETVGHGGLGKSALTIAEALAMATGKALLGKLSKRPLRVWYYNGEDPDDELARRFGAAAKHFGVTNEDLGTRLFVNSGVLHPLTLAFEEGHVAHINEGIVRAVVDQIERHQIDVLILDPFVKLHTVSENDNVKMDKVIRVLTQIAVETNSSIMVVHHLRKTGGAAGTVEDGRGASALLAAARSARVLNVMTKEEADGAGIDPVKRRLYFSADRGKSNLSPPAEYRDWFRMESIDLGNASDELSESDKVGVVTIYKYPTPTPLNISPVEIHRILGLMASGGPWRLDLRARRQPWVGLAVAQATALDPKNKFFRAKIAKLVSKLIADGILEIFAQTDSGGDARTYVRRGSKAEEVLQRSENASPS
jgi:hypothetical protein